MEFSITISVLPLVAAVGKIVVGNMVDLGSKKKHTESRILVYIKIE